MTCVDCTDRMPKHWKAPQRPSPVPLPQNAGGHIPSRTSGRWAAIYRKRRLRWSSNFCWKPSSIRSAERISGLDRTHDYEFIGSRRRTLRRADGQRRCGTCPASGWKWTKFGVLSARKTATSRRGTANEVGSVWTFCCHRRGHEAGAVLCDGAARPCPPRTPLCRTWHRGWRTESKYRLTASPPYPEAVRRAFGKNVDYGQNYQGIRHVFVWERRYSTSGVIAAPKYVQEGRPDPPSASLPATLNASTPARGYSCAG